jgi:hypothetical protein
VRAPARVHLSHLTDARTRHSAADDGMDKFFFDRTHIPRRSWRAQRCFYLFIAAPRCNPQASRKDKPPHGRAAIGRGTLARPIRRTGCCGGGGGGGTGRILVRWGGAMDKCLLTLQMSVGWSGLNSLISGSITTLTPVKDGPIGLQAVKPSLLRFRTDLFLNRLLFYKI